jgi:integrase
MPRARSGTLVRRATSYYAKLWLTRDGAARREYICLDTLDPVLARRTMRKLVDGIARGEIVADARAKAVAAESVEVAARAWVVARAARGVKCAEDGGELGYLVHHVFPYIGPMPVNEVRKLDCKRVLDAATEARGKRTGEPLKRETIDYLKRLLVRFFNALESDEVIPSNPMRLVKMPEVKADKRRRTRLTDDEYSALLSAPIDFAPTIKTGLPSVREVEFFELKVVAFTARTLGGARAAECLRWTWDMVDRPGFESCRLARAKGGDVQELVFPETLRPFLSGWWLASGSPDRGPVFPVSRGKRKGEARGKSNLAGRFRRALLRAGVTRHEVHNDTPFSKRTDFHTLRRAYVSALAKMGANEATSMALAHHHDSSVHQRYQLEQIQAVPLAALPQVTLPDDVEKYAPRTFARGVTSPNPLISRAGEGIRTLDVHLGKVALYH